MRPYSPANSVQIAGPRESHHRSTASSGQLVWNREQRVSKHDWIALTCKHFNSSSIANKKHVDRCPAPDNAQIHSVAAKGRWSKENDRPQLGWNLLLSGSSVGSWDGEHRQGTPFVCPQQFRMPEERLQALSVLVSLRATCTIALISIRSTFNAMQWCCVESRSVRNTEKYGVGNGTANLTTTPHRGPVRGSISDGGSSNKARHASDQSASLIQIPRRHKSHRRLSASSGQLSSYRKSSVSKHD